MIWSTDLELRPLYISPSIQSLTGQTPEEAVAGSILDMPTPASASLAWKTLTDTLAAAKTDRTVLDQPHTLLVEVNRKGGGMVWAEIRASILRDRDGTPVGVCGITRDVGDRVRAEEALRESEQRYRLLTESTGDWVWEIGADGRYIYPVPRVMNLLGYEPKEVLGKTPFDLMPADEAKRVRAIFDRIASRQVPFVALENVLLHKKGSQVVVETTGVPFFDAQGGFLGYQGCDREITERRRAERELKEYSTALEATNRELASFYEAAKATAKAKSRCLANMSHEIRTPMTAILGFADVLLESLGSRRASIDAAQTIKRNGVYLLGSDQRHPRPLENRGRQARDRPDLVLAANDPRRSRFA